MDSKNKIALFSEYQTIDGINSAEGVLKMLIATTADDDAKVRFNIVQMVNGKVKANICALISNETAELFRHHLISSCASTLHRCECGGTLKVL